MTAVKTLGVAGAGPMGAGIAQIGLTAGLDVVLYDLSAEAMARAAADIHSRIARLEEKGQLAEGFAAAAKGRLLLAGDLAAFAPCDLVIEAVIERLDIKQKLFSELEAVVRADTVLATNTSSLSVAAIASGCRHKDRVCGLHFFNPVPVMKLVEVIAAPATSAETVALVTEVSKQIGKVPVTVKDAPGFLVNLQGRAYALEGLAIVQEGVTDPATVDRIMRDAAGFRMGPFELMDLTGIDVNYAATSYIYEGYQHDSRLKTTTLHQLMANAGLFGRKTGRGFFDYADGASLPPAPSVPQASVTVRPRIVEPGAAWDPITAISGFQAGDEVSLIAPVGEDCATACTRLGLDPASTVAVDLTFAGKGHLSLMSAVGGGAAAAKAADWLRCSGFTVEVIQDSPGFVVQRVLAMVANLGCELAQIGVATPADVDLAMKLAQNYPKGPLEWGDWLGLAQVHEIMRQLQAITGSDRYRPSLWLRRRAQLGLSVYQEA
jgi:3-hydroxybutyryl-CoA dehydrogenase